MRSHLEVPPHRRPTVLGVVAVCAALASPAGAVEVNGSARAWFGSTDAAGLESDEEDRTFRLALTQELTPWLSLYGSFRSTSFRTDFATLPAFERTSTQPEIGLSYDRRRLSARLLFSDRAIRTTDESQNLDIRTFLANFDWRPRRGPRYGLRFQDSTSTADTALFGRDNESRNVNFRADYSRATWSARYSFTLSNIENNVTGLSLEQSRHELRAGYTESLWQDRWSITLDARYAEARQTQDAPSGAAVALPLPAVEGLFAIDTTPALDALEAAPQLIDGDTTAAAAPGIDIGGANTFRNIGLDLGISRPVSQLEITVDGPSGALVWQVWTSPDNSTWFQLDSATTTFDAGFLRYTIRFAETTTRYVKAVNVSVNPVAEVAVTEVRALLETNELDRSEGSGSEYWLNLRSSLQLSDRIELSLGANLRRDQDLVATTLRRSYDERGVSAQLRTGLTDDLELRLGFRANELEEDLAPRLQRRTEVATAVLDWRPLETVAVIVTAQQREETDEGRLISSTDSVALQALTEILPRLVLNSSLGFAEVLNTDFGFSQETRYIIETLEARPNERWLLAGSLARFEYDSQGNSLITSRSRALLRASWFATPFLSLTSELVRGEDDLGDTTTRRFGAQWAPGAKLSLSTNYFDTDSSAGSGTSNFSFDGSYRMNRWIRVWLAINQAETLLTTQQTARTETLRVGLNAVF